jgi:hypothetical protein
MVAREGKAANPFHSLAALQKLAHHASFRTAPAVAFPHDWIFCTHFKLLQGVAAIALAMENLHDVTERRRNPCGSDYECRDSRSKAQSDSRGLV